MDLTGSDSDKGNQQVQDQKRQFEKMYEDSIMEINGDPEPIINAELGQTGIILETNENKVEIILENG